MSSPRVRIALCTASILALAVVQAVRADSPAPNTIVIGGATLFKNFFINSVGSAETSNDFIDVNSDGQYGYNNSGLPLVQELAPKIDFTIGNGSAGNYAASTAFITQTPYQNVVYRSIGSVNGLQELLNTGGGLANPFASTPLAQVAEAWVNGNQVVVNGVTNSAYPSHSTTTGMPTFTPIAGTDIAVMDVASKWGLQAGTSANAAWYNKPTQAGYGTNPVISAANGTGATSTWSNLLVSRTVSGGSAGTVTFQNSGTGNNVLYDTTVASVPINVVSNPGVGRDKITQSELQTLYVTGRMPNGENLAAGTRSVGSGTRNAFSNSIGVDPSFTVGDNVGGEQTGNVFARLGATFQSTNMSGTGDLEQVVYNDRLAVGYEGSDTAGVPGKANAYGSLKVKFSTSADYVQSSLSTIINNNTTSGWLMGGNETFVTIGDPNSTSWAGSTEGGYTIASNQTMANSAAALYIRNLTESIKNYSVPQGYTSTSNYYMPGQYMAENFILTSARQYVQNATDGTFWENNGAYNSTISGNDLASTTLNNKFNAKLVSDATIGAGIVPFRNGTTSYAYSDTVIGQNNVNGSYRYFDASSTSNTDYRFAAGGTTLNARNKIAGDFNNTGLRDLNQIPAMMAAVANPTQWAFNNKGGSAGALGATGAAVPEILGDFNGDGTFDSKDVRYFADGLAIDPATGNLNRKTGFTMVDAASPNYFGTVFTQSVGSGPGGSTPVRAIAYNAGDSRGDIAGSAQGPTPGAGPTGADGKINDQDINYTINQIKLATGSPGGVMDVGSTINGGTVDSMGQFSTLLPRAAITGSSVGVTADLSADMTGDLAINKFDLNELVQTTLKTRFGDVNLDGTVGDGDLSLLLANYGKPNTGWGQGNFLGTPTVNDGDLSLLLANYNQSGPGSLPTSFSTGGSGPVIFGGGGLGTAATPEPASLAVLALGAGAVLIRRRKR